MGTSKEMQDETRAAVAELLDLPFESWLGGFSYNKDPENAQNILMVDLKAEKDGNVFYASGDSGRDIDEAAEKAVEALWERIGEFEGLDETDAEGIEEFVKMQLLHRDSFEEILRIHILSSEEMEALISPAREAASKEEALRISNGLDLTELYPEMFTKYFGRIKPEKREGS